MPNDARPSNQQPVTEPLIYEAVRQFVLTYGLPAVALENIYQGWQNRAALPFVNDFVVISILWTTQHGTAVEEFVAESLDKQDPGYLTYKALREIVVQVDFCSNDDTARQRAERAAIMARTPLGVTHFNDFGFSSCYSDDVRDLSFIGSEDQYIRRYMISLHLSSVNGVTADYDYFDTVAIERLENVDVHHPVIPRG